MLFKNITLARPLAIIDLETTGTDAREARIVEISIMKIMPDGDNIIRTRRVNPGVPIPAAATAVHEITDADVANEPPFRRLARGVVEFLEGCDLCGFNLRKYDLRVLCNELKRCNLSIQLAGRSVVDALRIYHERERRDLTAALKFYCGMEHEGAHGAEADVLATMAILDAQVARYEDLPRTIDELHALQINPDALDFDGHFRKDESGRIFFNFGKYKDQSLDEIASDPIRRDYLGWMMNSDFLDDTKAIVGRAIADAEYLAQNPMP